MPLGNGPQGLAALEGGSIQLAQNNTDFMLLANAKGLKLQMVVGEWGQQFAFVARKGLTLPHLSEGYPAVMKDLVGDKVGVSARGAGTEYAMRAALSQAVSIRILYAMLQSAEPRARCPHCAAGWLTLLSRPLRTGRSSRVWGLVQ